MHTVESRILPRCSLNEAMFSFKSIIVLCRSLFFKIFSRRPYSYITETLAYNECMNIFTATAAKKIVMRLGVMEVTCLGQQQCLINKALRRTRRERERERERELRIMSSGNRKGFVTENIVPRHRDGVCQTSRALFARVCSENHK